VKQPDLFLCCLALALGGLLAAPAAFPCTTFVLKGGGRIYFGRNLDWDWEDGVVVVNPRGLKKTALVEPGHPAASWTSKYGSVTFNQFGREQPFGGMNEAGLVIENMMLFESQYPAPDSRPEINLLQWIQYQLDTCRTVAEVIATDSRIRLAQPTVPARIHYLLCDAGGDCATIEFLGGKMVCHRGQTLPCRALANNNYEESVANARAHPAPGSVSERLKDTDSLTRFACAASRAAEFKPHSPEKDIDYAFDILEQVRQGKGTVWQIVYDIPGRQIHYRTLSNPRPRRVELKALDFTHARTVRFVDIQAAPLAAGKPEWTELTEARLRDYLQTFFAKESLKKGMGDLTPMIEPLLMALRGYTLVDDSRAKGAVN
jgi:penicillin V acylase-like amidase (Ntn superfamily)